MPEEFDPAWEYAPGPEQSEQVEFEPTWNEECGRPGVPAGFSVRKDPNWGFLKGGYWIPVFPEPKPKKEKPPREPVILTCRFRKCQKRFLSWTAQRRYCGPLCARKAHYWHYRGARRIRLPMVPLGPCPPKPARRQTGVVLCATCQRPFDQVRREQRYCSRACSRNRPDKDEVFTPTVKPKACGWCHKLFQPKRNDRRFCSGSCARFYRHRMRKDGECSPF